MKKYLKIGIVIYLIIGFITTIALVIFDSKSDTAPYIKAVSKNNYAKAHAILDKLHADYLEGKKSFDFSTSSTSPSDAFWAAANHIYKAEMLYLLPMNDSDANNRMIYTLQSMNAVGTKPSNDEVDSWSDDDNERYIEFSRKYNQLCDEILSISITYGNENMANSIVRLYKDDYISQDGKKERYKVYIPDNSPAKNARKRLEQARQDGLFN